MTNTDWHCCISTLCTWFLQDDDPYVRKTAAVCVAKLHDINSELVEDRGFLDTLKVKHVLSFTPVVPPGGLKIGP